MELREFVKTTLVEIAEGVKEAKDEYQKMGGEVNPRSYTMSGQKNVQGVSEIAFDIALTQMDKTDASKGIGVLFSSVKIGAGKTEEQGLSSVSRVSFTVAVKLP